jgi:hypothetical protein
MTEHGEEAIRGLVRSFSSLRCLDQGRLPMLTFRDVPDRARNSFNRAIRTQGYAARGCPAIDCRLADWPPPYARASNSSLSKSVSMRSSPDSMARTAALGGI